MYFHGLDRHALQLRQAKLSFPTVHLIVGVCSDLLVAQHKAPTVMTHTERCECVRHCRWVDEVVADAPWIINQEFIDEHKIDYVAHDEDPYAGSDGSKDIYQFVKDQGTSSFLLPLSFSLSFLKTHFSSQIGKFLPTRRTPGVSTSDLLQRVVAGYRVGEWDNKLLRSGHPDLQSTSMPGSPAIRSRAHTPPPGMSLSGVLSPSKLGSPAVGSPSKTPPA